MRFQYSLLPKTAPFSPVASLLIGCPLESFLKYRLTYEENCMFLCNKLTEFLPERQHRTGISSPGAASCLFWRLHRLPNHIPHGIRRLPHHVRCGMGVGAESEARAVMPQGAGQGLHIHPVL